MARMMRLWLALLGIDVTRLEDYLRDPSGFHAKPLDPEDVMD